MLHTITKKVFLLIVLFGLFSQTTFAQQQDGDPAAGETLFKNNCRACHSFDEKVLVGPGLKGIEDRAEYDWIKHWIQNPQKMIESGDEYANKIYNDFNKLAMTAFPTWGDEEVSNVLAYIRDANQPKDEVAAGGEGGAAVAQQTGGGKFFNILLISLLGVMVLVLIALMTVIKLLSTMETTENGVEAESLGANPVEKTKALLKHPTVATAIVALFLILGTKAIFDGMYSIGVHQGYAPAQPINFSHKLHAGDMEIDCSYCHTGVYKGKQANIPSSNICMNCHNTIKRESPEIQKIYKAIETDTPIEWVRVHNLPDLAYFNHSQHTVVADLDCENCHGDVRNMEVLQQRTTLTMGWCIDCHRQTDVNAKGNAYYDALLTAHEEISSKPMKVEDIGGLECAKCHY